MPYWRSRVRPGTSATSASRVRVSRLNNVDLPTLGLPTMTRVGFNAASLGSLSAQGEQIPVLRLHQEPAVEPHERRSDRGAVGSDTADEGAAFSRQEMHLSLDVADRDFSPQGQRRGEAPQEQAILLPDCRAAGAVQSMHRTFVVADEDVTRVERQPRGARYLTRPDRVAAG